MINIDLAKISSITKDSRTVKAGSVYFCFIGEAQDGHDYITTAFKQGASYVVGTKDFEHQNYIKVRDIDFALSDLSQRFFKFNEVKMKFIGLTGTDGKTSVSCLVDALLNQLSTSAYLGTSGLSINGKVKFAGSMTTPFANDLFNYIDKAASKKANYFVMEASSHGLKQRRILGLEYDVIGFTNFTSDHLDFHKTLEDYFNSKLLIFDYLKPDGFALVNGDDPMLSKLDDPRIKTFGKSSKCDYQISNLVTSLSGIEFDLIFDEKSYKINSLLLADFNAYNLTQAIAIVHHLGYDLSEIIKHVSMLKVAGRLELYKNENCADVILDFAHTDDSIKKVMTFVNTVKKDQKVWVVTGSAGGRDHVKRPLMGQAAAEFSDFLVLTEDDPRSESVLDICNDLKSGITNEKCVVSVIENRIGAISFCMNKSSKNDIIIILGKSGQAVMYYDGYTTEYIESNVVMQLIKEIDEGY